MMDTRDLDTIDVPLVNLHGEQQYWKKTAAINHMYAKRHGHTFTYYKLGDVPAGYGWNINWMKPKVFLNFLNTMNDATRCGWVLYVDSDAMIIQHDMPLETFFNDVLSPQFGIQSDTDKDVLSPQFGIQSDTDKMSDVNVILELEEGASAALLNAGVFLANGNAKNFMETWMDAGRSRMCRGLQEQ